jgi:hypothetical protein
MVIVVEHGGGRAVGLIVTVLVNTLGRLSVVLVLVVSQVMRVALAALVKAIRLHGRPDGLKRQQYQQENGDPSTHGGQYIGQLGIIPTRSISDCSVRRHDVGAIWPFNQLKEKQQCVSW